MSSLGEEIFSMWHVRCFSCGKILADKQLKYEELILDDYSYQEALDFLGITRSCCRNYVMGEPIFSEGVNPEFPKGSGISIMKK